MELLRIEPRTDTTATHTGIKTRTFRAVKLAHVTADMLWQGASGDTIRPVWIAFGGTPTALNPFVANLRNGKRAEVVPERQSYRCNKPTRYELLRSAGYAYTHYRVADDSIAVVAAMDSVLTLDPGLVTERVQFLALPPRWWVEQQHAQFHADAESMRDFAAYCRRLPAQRTDLQLPSSLSLRVEDLLPLVPIAVYVRSYLDRRTRRPTFMTAAFAVQLYLAGLATGVFSLSRRFVNHPIWEFGTHAGMKFLEEGTEEVGLLPGVVCTASHDAIDALLAREAARYSLLTHDPRTSRMAA